MDDEHRHLLPDILLASHSNMSDLIGAHGSV